MQLSVLLKENAQSVQKQVQQIDNRTGVLKELIVLLDLQGNFIGSSTNILFVDFGIGGEGVEQNFSNFQMKQLLFNFGVHKNLIRNIAF